MRKFYCRVSGAFVFSLAALTALQSFAQDDASENLLQNGQFEEGENDAPDSWSQGASVPGVEYIWDENDGHESDSSLCLHKTQKKFFPIAQWFQIIDPPVQGDTITVSSHVKAEDVTKAIIDVIFLDDSGEWISHEWVCYIGAKNERDKPANHDWKKYSGKVKIPSGTKQIQVALQIYGPGKVWFDNVRMSTGEGGGAEGNQSRTWTDATGKYKVKAVFVSVKDGKVTIKRDDNGEMVTLELSNLSKKCQRFVKSRK